MMTVAIAVSVLIALAAVMLWKVPQVQIERFSRRHPTLSPAERLKGEIDLRSTLAQILGGGVLLAGLYFTAKTYALQQQGQLTDRINKAVEQLGSEKQDVSLGGVYQVARIAQDSERDHWPMLQVLMAATERRAPLEALSPAQQKARCDPEYYYNSSQTADYIIQAVANVLRTRDTSSELPEQRISITHANLQSVDLSDAILTGARFIGDDMRGAILTNTVLDGGAQLSSSLLNEANLSGAKLPGANLYKACLVRAQLTGADFHGSHLENADLRNVVDSKGADFSDAVLDHTNLSGADLSTAKGLTARQLSQAIWDCDTKFPPELAGLPASRNCLQ